METIQNIIILVLTLICTWLYFDRKDLKYWRDYYHNCYKDAWDNYHTTQCELDKAEEIISQQKQELLTRKQSKKK